MAAHAAYPASSPSTTPIRYTVSAPSAHVIAPMPAAIASCSGAQHHTDRELERIG